MDNILEILIPLAIAAVYFFGNMFSGKSDDDEATPPSLSRKRGAGEEEADAVEEQRRVQEEIRRKIMERRRDAEGEQPTMAPSGQEISGRRDEIGSRRDARRKREVPAEVPAEVPKPTSPYSESSYEGESEPAAHVFAWDTPNNAYENSMQAKLRRIEETKRKAEKLKKQAAERNDLSKSKGKQQKSRTGGYFSGTVRQSLQDPQAARVAFIYGEVIGQPVSLRKESNSSVPGLGRS